MTVIDMPLQVRLRTKSLSTSRIGAFVVLAMISLVVPGKSRLVKVHNRGSSGMTGHILEFVRLVKRLVATRLITTIYTTLGRRHMSRTGRRVTLPRFRAVQ